jgi:thiosulfate reductase cytochrome b subunit
VLRVTSPERVAARSRWRTFAWIAPVAAVLAVLIVLLAQWLRAQAGVQSFLADFPGESELPAAAPVGFPAWLAWQHGLNAFFLLFIIRSGLLVRRTGRPPGFWKRNNAGLVRTKGQPIRVSIHVWLHLAVDTLWSINGILFFVLIFATGQWMRVVPTNWDVVPNALSALLQYVSLDWPTENGWVNYNALQLLSYFVVVFVAAPLSLLTGLRTVPGLAARLRPLDRVFSIAAARTLHFWLMIFFIAFTVVHVALVLATGAQRNLNHMYAARDDGSWLGVIIFAASVVVAAGTWFALQPVVVRTLAGLTGTVSR